MRIVLQRVIEGRVDVDDVTVGSIGRGLTALVGVTHGDTPAQADALAKKVARLRLFPGEAELDLSVVEAGLAVLVVSQFTLYGDTRKGRRPSWSSAAPAGHAEPLVDDFERALQTHGVTTASGAFGADMRVHQVGWGPITLVLEATAQ